jgi:hypothetical protein
VSCGWPDLNVEPEIADAVGELGCGAGWVAACEMIGAKILVARPSANMWYAVVRIEAATATTAFLGPRRAFSRRN